MSVRHLESLLRPSSVALVGASDQEGSLGCVVLRNLKSGGFKGAVWAVNHRHATVAGEQAWADLASLPAVPDLVIVCTPAQTVPGIISQAGAKGARAAIVVSAGLQAATCAGGPSIQQAMLDAARPWVLRILGPNCIGELVPGLGLNASFAPAGALPGNLAFVSQSGALATAMLDWAGTRGIGFSHFVSLGDSADVDFGDMLDYLASDAGTRAILLYIESVRGARKFMSAARAAARNKPVIVVKAGRAPEGARAAASHTGALAGSDVVFDAAIRRAGMLRVDTLEALFDAAETLSRVRSLRGERLAVVTNGGGAGVLACDALSRLGGHLADLSDSTRAALDLCLPPTWSHGNPIDIVGDAPVGRYEEALRIVLAAPEVDAVLFIHAPTAVVSSDAIAVACIPLLQRAEKPALACWLGGASVAAARARSMSANLACYETPERAIAAWMQLVDYDANQRALQQLCNALDMGPAPDRTTAQALLDRALAEGREWLGPQQVQELLNAYGIATPASGIARDAQEAVALAGRLGYPVALKVVSPQVVHKSDVGGVALGLVSGDEVLRAVASMQQNMARLAPDAVLEGFLVQAMVVWPDARELIVGIAGDALFGPVMLFGEGGTTVEMRKAHAVALPPLNAALAQDLVDRSHCAPLLRAHRGVAPVDAPALLSTLVKVSRMACDLPVLAELDINPLLADAKGVLALDARVRVRAVVAGTTARLAIRPYPHALEERVRLAGQEFWLRPIQPDDGRLLEAFYADASPQDLRLRFFFARREVPRSELARYSQIDYDREMAFVAMVSDASGAPVIAADIHAACDPDNRQAEFSLQVATPWQGMGLGRTMLAKMIGYLRARGTGEVVGTCLPENVAMASLAKGLGFVLSEADGAVSMALRLQ